MLNDDCFRGLASAKNQTDFFDGIAAAARQASSAIDLPYVLMYQSKLSDGEPIYPVLPRAHG